MKEMISCLYCNQEFEVTEYDYRIANTVNGPTIYYRCPKCKKEWMESDER